MSRDADLVEVVLLGYPLALRERSIHHGADLVREMALLVGGQSSSDRSSSDRSSSVRTSGGRTSGGTRHPVPHRLVEVATELQQLYGPFTESTTEELEAATDRGEDTLDRVVYRVPRSSAADLRHLAEVLQEAEAFCRAGQHLLMLAAPPEIATFRDWLFTEVQNQVAGDAPVSWPAYLTARRDAGQRPRASASSA